MKVRLPNFLFVGAPRCGSTSIYYYLKSHCHIFLPEIDEIHFLIATSIIENFDSSEVGYPHGIPQCYEDYVKLYKNVKTEKMIGDTSPGHLYFYKTAIPNIKKYLGENVKIMMQLRNPVERAFFTLQKYLSIFVGKIWYSSIF